MSEVIPKPTPNEGLDLGTSDPGRGGSDVAGPGGAAGALSGQPENLEQRDPSGLATPASEKNSEKTFAYGETELAAVTGMALKGFQKLRAKKLTRGVDWDLAGLRVAFSADGLVKALELVSGERAHEGRIGGVPIAELQAKTCLLVPEPRRDDLPAAEPLLGTVRRFYPNPHLMEVTLADGRRVNVRVQTVKNFREGMTVPVRPSGTAGIYELGRRAPRFPGRW